MYGNSVLFAVAVVLVTATFGQAAFAKSCEEKSPNYTALGDNYFSTEKLAVISDKDKITMSELYEKIPGEWVGERIWTECENNNPDNDSSLIHGYKNARVTVVITMDPTGAISMGAILYYKAKKAEDHQVTTVFHGVVSEAKVINGDTIAYAEKLYEKAGRARNFKESIGRLKVSDKAYVLAVSNYINGYFVSEETWNLKPGRR